MIDKDNPSPPCQHMPRHDHVYIDRDTPSPLCQQFSKSEPAFDVYNINRYSLSIINKILWCAIPVNLRGHRQSQGALCTWWRKKIWQKYSFPTFILQAIYSFYHHNEFHHSILTLGIDLSDWQWSDFTLIRSLESWWLTTCMPPPSPPPNSSTSSDERCVRTMRRVVLVLVQVPGLG